MSPQQCSPHTCGGPTKTCGDTPGTAQADIDTTSTSLEDGPVETLAEAHSDGDRVLPNRQKRPVDPMRYMTHSPKHPDCEICSRTMAQSAPCRRQHKPHPPAAPRMRTQPTRLLSRRNLGRR
eukprot:481112-Pyramimonas_sp.AAC.1